MTETIPLTGDALIARKMALILEGVGECQSCDGKGEYIPRWRGSEIAVPCEHCEGTGRSDIDPVPF